MMNNRLHLFPEYQDDIYLEYFEKLKFKRNVSGNTALQKSGHRGAVQPGIRYL